MNGYRLRVWVGRDGIMFVSCFSVSIVVSGLSYAAQSLRCLLRAGVCFDSSVDLLYSVGIKRRILCEAVWVWPDVSM